MNVEAPPDVEKMKATAEYKKLKRLLGDREWRLDNLYWIIDENGNKIKFVRNETQRAFSKEMHTRDLIPKARKLGFSTFIAILICDTSIFRSNTVSGITDRSLDDAEDKLAMVAFAYDNLPDDIRKAVPTVRRNTREIEWANGSQVSVGVTYRGGTPSILHISEYGKTSVDSPNVAREIKTGAIQAVPASGKVFIESTAHGTGGEFREMVRRAQNAQAEGRQLTALDFKLHFFGWWRKREYRVPNHLVLIPQELKEYFEETEAKYGIKLDADQRAFYAVKHAELGPDDIKQEFPTTIDEIFFASIEGAYFKREMTKARQDGRIGQAMPFDPTRRVNTTCDIGEDCNSIWWHQTDGVRHRFIDYYEEEGGSLQSLCAKIHEKSRERGFVYDKHYGPHDFDRREWGANANNRVAIAESLGIKITPVPQVDDKADSIEAARRMIGLSWFDAENCARGVECLDNYRKKWNDRMAQFMSDPVHDWASHGADAFQQIAMGLSPEKPPRLDRHRRPEERRTSQWAA